MRKTALSLVVAVLAVSAWTGVGPAVQVAAAATASSAKVVIVVGATHGATSTYRTRADAAYAEALKHTPNVTRVYSPNATWPAVRDAIQGANVVIYMGHGNGFPSPYRTTPWPYSQNGFGLNAAAGQGDNNTTYYGEHYIATEVDLAPNAVVMLHHLCYAAGNSEPGHAEPTVSVAKQRADNYAAGFLAAGAGAVIADGHMSPNYYLNALFTSDRTIDELWRGAPNAKGNTFAFASIRTAGATVQMDPTTPTSGFLRAVSGNLGLRTSAVTGSTPVAPPTDPSTLVVPGNAAVAVDGAGLFADATMTPDPTTLAAPASVARDARVRLLSRADAAGVPVFEVAAFDGSFSGWMAGTDLVAGDNAAPVASNVSTGAGLLSPNGDGRLDTLTVSARLSEVAWWRVRFWSGSSLVWSGSGTGSSVAATWSGWRNGAFVPDGTYRWTLETTDDWGNRGEGASGEVTVDTTAPQLTSLSVPVNSTTVFTPNGDRRYDTFTATAATSEAGAIELRILDGTGRVVRRIEATTGGTAPVSVTWDGRNDAGAVVPEGSYTARFAAADRAGNVSSGADRRVDVITFLSRVLSSVDRFYPQDNDRFAPTTQLTMAIARPATVTWRITTLSGAPVLTVYNAAVLAAGEYAFTWNGLDQAGRPVAPGLYTSYVSANDGTRSIVQKVWVEADAFSIRPTDTTPARGQTIDVSAYSSEPISGNVYLHVYQPGLGAWSVKMSKLSSLSYKARITFRSSSAGEVSLRVSALDADGRWQRSYLRLPLS